MQNTPILHYHQQTFDLIRQTPYHNQAAMQLFEQWQHAGFTLPPAVREWYALVGVDMILSRYSNGDHPISFTDLQSSVVSSGLYYGREVTGRRLLPFIAENQGCAVWLIDLTGDDDPPIIQWLDDYGEGDQRWDHFSTFLFEWVWQHLYWQQECFLFAREPTLTNHDLAWLRATFIEVPTSSAPSIQFYHFTFDKQHIHVWPREEHVEWWLAADSENELLALTRKLWHIASLRHTLQIAPPACATCPDRVLNIMHLGSAEAVRALGEKDIEALLVQGIVRFVVDDGEHDLMWIAPSEARHFWQTEIQGKIAERKRHPAAYTEHEFPSGYYYFAEEWEPIENDPVILLYQETLIPSENP